MSINNKKILMNITKQKFKSYIMHNNTIKYHLKMLLQERRRAGSFTIENTIKFFDLARRDEHFAIFELINACGSEDILIKKYGYYGVANCEGEPLLLMVNTLKKDFQNEMYKPLVHNFVCNMANKIDIYKELSTMFYHDKEQIMYQKNIISYYLFNPVNRQLGLAQRQNSDLLVKLQILLDTVDGHVEIEKDYGLSENEIIYLQNIYRYTKKTNLKIKILQTLQSMNLNQVIYFLNDFIQYLDDEIEILKIDFSLENISLIFEIIRFLANIKHKSQNFIEVTRKLFTTDKKHILIILLNFAITQNIFFEFALEKCIDMGISHKEIFKIAVRIIKTFKIFDLQQYKAKFFLLAKEKNIKFKKSVKIWCKLLCNVIEFLDKKTLLKLFLENPMLCKFCKIQCYFDNSELHELFCNIHSCKTKNNFFLIYSILEHIKIDNDMFTNILKLHLDNLIEFDKKSKKNKSNTNYIEKLLFLSFHQGFYLRNHSVLLCKKNELENFNLQINVLDEIIDLYTIVHKFDYLRISDKNYIWYESFFKNDQILNLLSFFLYLINIS